MIIDGGQVNIGLESTIVDFSEGSSGHSASGVSESGDAGERNRRGHS